MPKLHAPSARCRHSYCLLGSNYSLLVSPCSDYIHFGVFVICLPHEILVGMRWLEMVGQQKRDKTSNDRLSPAPSVHTHFLGFSLTHLDMGHSIYELKCYISVLSIIMDNYIIWTIAEGVTLLWNSCFFFKGARQIQ